MDLDGPTAHLAIRCKPLAGDAGINDHLAGLPAKRALDVSEFFHAGI